MTGGRINLTVAGRHKKTCFPAWEHGHFRRIKPLASSASLLPSFIPLYSHLILPKHTMSFSSAPGFDAIIRAAMIMGDWDNTAAVTNAPPRKDKMIKQAAPVLESTGPRVASTKSSPAKSLVPVSTRSQAKRALSVEVSGILVLCVHLAHPASRTVSTMDPMSDPR